MRKMKQAGEGGLSGHSVDLPVFTYLAEPGGRLPIRNLSSVRNGQTLAVFSPALGLAWDGCDLSSEGEVGLEATRVWRLLVPCSRMQGPPQVRTPAAIYEVRCCYEFKDVNALNTLFQLTAVSIITGFQACPNSEL